ASLADFMPNTGLVSDHGISFDHVVTNSGTEHSADSVQIGADFAASIVNDTAYAGEANVYAPSFDAADGSDLASMHHVTLVGSQNDLGSSVSI
ncbi:MAG: hypothetical protein HY235_25245, partial [Acidobacteria bacterium]|nr:hypothetical protein [Acidobacteriota bacterium]